MIMKKQQQERSARYRFWRNVGIITVSGLIGGVIGFLTGMFGSEKPLEIQSFFSKEVLLFGICSFIPDCVYDYDGLTDVGKKSPSKDASNRR